MADSISETGNFTPDLFSPLQFCEVVEEGQQQHHRLQLHRHHSQLGPHAVDSQLHQQSASNSHQHEQVHQPPQQQTSLPQQQNQVHSNSQTPHQHSHQSVVNQQIQQQSSHHQQQPKLQPHSQPQVQHAHQESQQNQDNSHRQSNGTLDSQPHQSTIKQEGLPPANQLLDSQTSIKYINMHSSMEIYLSTQSSNSLTAQSLHAPVVALQQQPTTPNIYQMQLTRPQQQQVQQIPLNSLQIQNPQQLPIEQQLQNAIDTTAVVGIPAVETFTLPLSSPQIISSPATAVASQATQTELSSCVEEDEPEIIFSTTPKYSSNGESERDGKDNGYKTPKSDCDVKPFPIKKTWRRPWKKKKEREKRPAMKKIRRVKRRKIVVPRKNNVQVDPKFGPPIDTLQTLVQRQSQEHINQLKQKRQRIKLNRNSGREYINRLGKVVCARKIGSPCNCPLKCWDRMGSKVLDIFNNFWDLCDFNLQNSYLFTCLKLCDVKRRYTKKQPAEESRRQNTFEYFVRINGRHFRVCEKAFMNSHGLTSDKRLRTLFAQMKDGALIPELDKRGKHLRPNKPPTPGGAQNGNNIETLNNLNNKIATKTKIRTSKKKQQVQRTENNKQAMYTPPHSHIVTHIHPPPPPPQPAHGTNMQEPPHTYIPNGDIYFPGHYLEPPQAMAPHMNQIPCQKMLETPAYFMAGMKENTFHQ